MQKGIRIIVCLILIVVYGLAANATINLCDYRVPQMDLHNMRFSFNYRHFDDAKSDEGVISSGRLTLSYDRFLNTDTLGLTFSGNTEIGLQNFIPSSGFGQGALTLRSYVFEDTPSLFIFGGAEGSLAQTKSNLEIRAGVGYGTFSDVTPLAKAFTIQNELLKKGKIKEQLSDDVLLFIADQISQREEVTSMDELMSAIRTLIEQASGTIVDPAIVMVGMEFNTLQTLISEIADQVREVSGADLDAEALMIIQEQILVENDSRSCGFAVQGGVGYDLVSQKTLLTLSLDAAYPPDPSTQILLRTSFSGPLISLQESVLNISTSYDFFVKSDISLLANYTLQASPVGGLNAISHTASLELALQLSMGDLSLQLALTKASDTSRWSTDILFSLVVDLL